MSVIAAPSHNLKTSLSPALPSQSLWAPVSLGSYMACPGKAETTLSCSLVTVLSGEEVSCRHSSLHSSFTRTLKGDLNMPLCGQCSIPSLSLKVQARQDKMGWVLDQGTSSAPLQGLILRSTPLEIYSDPPKPCHRWEPLS